jgi:hypothetical protein
MLNHEWLHTIEDWSATFGAPVPPFDPNQRWPVHAARKFGYQNGSDPRWLADFMMMRIPGPPDMGSFGVGPDLLGACTTLSVSTRPAAAPAVRAPSDEAVPGNGFVEEGRRDGVPIGLWRYRWGTARVAAARPTHRAPAWARHSLRAG